MAGIDVVASYERWHPANETNRLNNDHNTVTADIRALKLAELPSDIDLVVGSPPCTQFSYSNRGGKGDIDDGLKDIVKFLEIVDYIRPAGWAMENVPRVAKIILSEIKPGGALERFSHLKFQVHVYNMEEFGLPQKRRRSIVGNLDFLLLDQYKLSSRRTLGEVVHALQADPVRDPLYGLSTPRHLIADHILEAPLNTEEVRINSASKECHPIYNSMSFPDRMDRPARTVTATCTRVSRESIIVADPCDRSRFRRLTLRERATLQGFPISYQFHGKSYGQKMKMIGNAVPPLFSYLVANALLGTPKDSVVPLARAVEKTPLAAPKSTDAKPENAGARYPETRNFRFAIPSLRLKSGVRFELVNRQLNDIRWRVNFYFGTSKKIEQMELGRAMASDVLRWLSPRSRAEISALIDHLTEYISSADLENLQKVWAHRGAGATRPFMLLDELDLVGRQMHESLARDDQTTLVLAKVLEATCGRRHKTGIEKLLRNSAVILAGLLLAETANVALDPSTDTRQVAPVKLIGKATSLRSSFV